MRFVALAILFTALPLIISLLRQHPHRRPLAFVALGLVLFFGDTLRIDAAIIGWPMWNGIVRGIQISIVDIIAVALIVTRRKVSGKLPFWGVIAFYGATLFVSVLQSTAPMASFFVCWQFLRMALVFAAIAGEIQNAQLRKGLLTGFSLGLMLQAGYVISQKASGVVQATGTMYHQNVLGMMTELALLPLLAALLAGDRRKILVAGIAAGLIVIAGGGSRGAMSIAGGGVVVLMILSLVQGVTPIKLRVVGLGVLALVVTTPLAMITLKDRFGSNSVTAQDDQRPAFERAARAMAGDHPFGVGANMYVPVANVQHYADRAGVAWNFANRSAPVHNAYLLSRAEAGWLGELAFILLLVVPFIAGLRLAFARTTIDREIVLGSAVAVGVNAVHNNFEFAGLEFNALMLLVINIAIVAAIARASRNPRSKVSKPNRRSNDAEQPAAGALQQA